MNGRKDIKVLSFWNLGEFHPCRLATLNQNYGFSVRVRGLLTLAH